MKKSVTKQLLGIGMAVTVVGGVVGCATQNVPQSSTKGAAYLSNNSVTANPNRSVDYASNRSASNAVQTNGTKPVVNTNPGGEHFVEGTIVNLSFAQIVRNQPLVIKSITIRVNGNGLTTDNNPDPNIPLKIGSLATLHFSGSFPTGVITPRIGDIVSDRYAIEKTKSDHTFLSGDWGGFFGPLSWVDLTSPVSGEAVSPGQHLHIDGFVADPSLWGKQVTVDILAGFLKPSSTWYETRIMIGKDGMVDSVIKLPNAPFPQLHGGALTLLMQPQVRQGPITQITLIPKPRS